MLLPKIYLCSTSPRRRELLAQIGVEFEVISLEVDERQTPNESPIDHVQRIAYQKALAGLKHTNRKEKIPVLSADTLILFNNQLIGKPANKDEFLSIMSQLSGNTHTVITAVTIMDDNFQETTVTKTKVVFREILAEELEYYWEKYHPIDKAGGYGIQDFGAVFVESIEGSYSNVVGLPLEQTYQMLKKLRK